MLQELMVESKIIIADLTETHFSPMILDAEATSMVIICIVTGLFADGQFAHGLV